MEKKLDGNYTRMLRAILNKSWRQHPTKQQLYGHLPPNTKAIQVRRARHAGHYTAREESDVLWWTPSHGQAKTGWPARTYIQQPCADKGCSLPEVMDDREGWRERVRDICAAAADDDDDGSVNNFIKKAKNPRSDRNLTARCSDNVDVVRDSVRRSPKKSLQRLFQEFGLLHTL